MDLTGVKLEERQYRVYLFYSFDVESEMVQGEIKGVLDLHDFLLLGLDLLFLV